MEEIVCAALICYAILFAWRRDDSILASVRAHSETWHWFIAELLGCEKCLAFHLPFWPTLIDQIFIAALRQFDLQVCLKSFGTSLAITGLVLLVLEKFPINPE